MVKGHYIKFTTISQQYTFRETHIKSKVFSDSRSDRAPVQRCYRGDTTGPRQFHLSGGEKGWGVLPCDEPQGAEPVCQTRALQDGRSPSSPIPDTAGRINGENGSQGCLPSGLNSPRPPQISSVPMGGQELSVKVPPIWLVSSTSGLYEATETCGWPALTDGSKNDHIFGQHSYTLSKHNSVRDSCHQLFEALGLMINRKKTLLAPTQQLEFLGFLICSQKLIILTPSEKLRKTRQEALHLLH